MLHLQSLSSALSRLGESKAALASLGRYIRVMQED